MDYDEDESLDDATEYDRDEYNQFVEDMRSKGWNVEDYHGRSMYHGPAVRVEDEEELQNAIRSTDLILQWDTLGFGWIVYPR